MATSKKPDYNYNTGSNNNNVLFPSNNSNQSWQIINNYNKESNTFNYKQQWQPIVPVVPSFQTNQSENGSNRGLFDKPFGADDNPYLNPKPQNAVAANNNSFYLQNLKGNPQPYILPAIPLSADSLSSDSTFASAAEEFNKKLDDIMTAYKNKLPNGSRREDSLANETIENVDISKVSKAVAWIKMAWRAFKGEQSPDVIDWQQNNRHAIARLASISDGIASSQPQRIVNAFSSGAVNTITTNVGFVGAELSRLHDGEQTATSKFLAQSYGFVLQEASTLYMGEKTKIGEFFDSVGILIADDLENLRTGQNTVIGSAVLSDFQALVNMRPEEVAYCLGNEVGNGFLIWVAASGLKLVGRGARALRAATTEVVEAGANKPVTFLYAADSFQAQQLRKDYIKQAPDFAQQYLMEIKQKPHILSQFNQRTQALVQSEEFWSLSGRGERFEKWLQSELGASGNFKVGGKEFDGKLGNIWIEAKSGNFWNNLNSGSNELKRFKSQIRDAQEIAAKHGGILQIHSDVRIPKNIVEYLDKKGIEYKIHTIFLEVEPCPTLLL